MTAIETATGRSPLHHWHVAHGAHVVERDGWHVPEFYSSFHEEVAAARTRLVLADLSPFAKVSLIGNQVDAVAQTSLAVSLVPKPGAVARLDGPTPALAFRLTQGHLLLLAESLQTDLFKRIEQTPAQGDVIISDATSAYAAFWLAGPRTDQVLMRLTALEFSHAAFPPGSCAETSVAGLHCLLARAPELECAYLLVSWDVGEYVWERILEAEREGGITAIGVKAWEQIWKMQKPPGS